MCVKFEYFIYTGGFGMYATTLNYLFNENCDEFFFQNSYFCTTIITDQGINRSNQKRVQRLLQNA